MTTTPTLRAGQSTVTSLFETRVRLHPDALAVAAEGAPDLSYAGLGERVRRAAGALARSGVGRGDRVAILSENRAEYLEAILACGALGAILACQNWRLAPPELAHCVTLVTPRFALVSPRHRPLLERAGVSVPGGVVEFGPEYEAWLAGTPAVAPSPDVDPEDGLLILYTSGTTGLPKGAVISHRAEIARSLVGFVELGTRPGDANVAWPPFFHMAGAEPALSTLMTGGPVHVVDGFRPDEIASLVERVRIGHLMLMPGMIEPLIEELERRAIRPAGLVACGAMADLVPAHQLARITTLLQAPYVNTFGSTETGAPPASGNRIPAGEVPERLSKQQNRFCEIRLVDAEDRDVPDGTPGELAIRGPTVFSGYWNAAQTNARDFRGGWFHMGDMFIRNADGTLDFVDRAKYMIKSGGENIYPAEIERVLLSDARVADAVVVRQPDARWGEVPVAIVAAREGGVPAQDLLDRCRAQLAGYKQPKGIVFVPFEELPRSTTGKIQRHEVEAWLKRRREAGG